MADRPEPMFASIRGQVFEAYVHRNFKNLFNPEVSKSDDGKALPLFELPAKLLTASGSEDVVLSFPQMEASAHFDTPATLPANTYGIPRSRNYASVDAVIRPDMALQMSVSEDHGYKTEGLKAVANGLGIGQDKALRVILVCPSSVASHVSLQKYYAKGKVLKTKPRSPAIEQYCLPVKWLTDV